LCKKIEAQKNCREEKLQSIGKFLKAKKEAQNSLSSLLSIGTTAKKYYDNK
jgi:hypothetical protein